jgi:hypothetical protein
MSERDSELALGKLSVNTEKTRRIATILKEDRVAFAVVFGVSSILLSVLSYSVDIVVLFDLAIEICAVVLSVMYLQRTIIAETEPIEAHLSPSATESVTSEREDTE